MDLVVSLIYALVVGLAGQTVWRRLIGEKHGSAFGVPLTLSSLVVVGAPVLSTEFAPRWPIILGVIVAAGWVANLHQGWSNRSTWKPPRPTLLQIVLVGLVVLGITISGYLDAVTHLGPSVSDTFAHANNVAMLKTGSMNTGYPIGFYALIQPLAFLVSEEALYRFVGPALGILYSVAIYLIARLFVSSVWALTAVAMLSSAAMNVFSLIRSSILPSSLSLLLVLALIAVSVSFMRDEIATSLPRPLWLMACFAVLVLALGLSVPYSLVTFTFVLGSWLLLATTSGWIRTRWSAAMVFVSVAGPWMWPVFRALRGDEAVGAAGSGAATVLQLLPSAPLAGETTNDATSIVSELLQLKGLRDPFGDVLSLGAYVVILGAAGVLLFAWRTTSVALKGLAIVVVAYGVALQTGFSELLTFRGRSGWYLFLFSALFIATVLFEVGSARSPNSAANRAFAVLPAILVFGSVMSVIVRPPNPESFRSRYKEATFQGVQIASDLLDSDDAVGVVSNVRLLSLLDSVDQVTPWPEVGGCPPLEEVAVVDFAPNLNPVNAVGASIRTGEDLQSAEEAERQRVVDLAQEAVAIEQRLDACGFVPVFSDDEVSVYLHG